MHKRNNEIAESEKDYFAKNFLRKYKSYTLADIKLFANMVCFCEIGEGLKAVDIGAINEKLVGYNQMRNNYLSDYYAKEDHNQSNSQQLISEIDGDPETQFELLKLKLKAYNAIREEFMQYALDYYRSQGVEVKGVLLPSRIPNYTEAIQEYLELHPNKFWVEYKEARDNKGLLPKGVQSSLQFADIF